MVSALFATLQIKNAAIASHSLRVALGCSRWAAALGMPDSLRIQLEAAALLHDVGKIGVADSVLQKPGRLTPDEMRSIDASRRSARKVLTAAGAPPAVLDGVDATGAWFDGSHRAIKLTGEETPFIARMIAIVDAYDSMTTDQVYRPARSHERALAELYSGAGTQFDPDLVTSFVEMHGEDQSRLDADVAGRWLPTIIGEGPTPWKIKPVATPKQQQGEVDPRVYFDAKLIDNLHDAVVFVDRQRIISHWNVGAERLTGVGSSAAVGKVFTPTLLDIADDAGRLLSDTDCPISETIDTGLQQLGRYTLVGRNGKRATVEMHTVPIDDDSGVDLGVAVMLRDVTSEQTLEDRCQALRAQSTKDPMTQVANRAEFDRMLASFVDAHQATGLPCSLIMADIDRFKSINDTYGHQAGDAAIITFAKLLKSMCRSGDLVARYGGEEFAILCADCNNATAARRAETIRKRLSETPHNELGGKRITASFGVTELQNGDTPETMLRRADRGLFQAKDQGRNQVVQLGNGMSETTKDKPSWFARWFGFGPKGNGRVIESHLVTKVPVALAVEKLKGFVADRNAKILKAGLNHLRLQVSDRVVTGKDGSTRPVEFVVDLSLAEAHVDRTNAHGFAKGKYVETTIDVVITTKRDRDRRGGKAADRGRLLLGNLKSYLMANEVEQPSLYVAPDREALQAEEPEAATV